MEHFNISNSWNESYDEDNISFNYYFEYCTINACYEGKEAFILYVFTWIIICICLPLTLLAIYSLSSLVRKDHGAPVYIINLLISDILQLLCMIGRVTDKNDSAGFLFIYLYYCGLLSSVGFMVCISLERYLLIAWPLWYRFRRTIKTSVVASVLVWIIPLVLSHIVFIPFNVLPIIYAVYFLLPLPLFIFFLGGTLKALSASLSVPSDEKRRIVSVLVVVLLIYTLMFLPTVIWLLAGEDRMNSSITIVSDILLLMSPLADLILYIFIKKGTTDKLLASLCCCRIQFRNHQMNSMNNDRMYTVSAM